MRSIPILFLPVASRSAVRQPLHWQWSRNQERGAVSAQNQEESAQSHFYRWPGAHLQHLDVSNYTWEAAQSAHPATLRLMLPQPSPG